MKFFPEEIISAFPLDWLKNQNCNIILVSFDRPIDFIYGFLFKLFNMGNIIKYGESNFRISNSWPLKLWEVFYFIRFRVCQGKCITAPAVKSFLEMKYLMPLFFSITFPEVLSYFPVKCNLQSVLY